ncbi:hypothetical protein HDU92_003598 [Lobulomyces angularis]|nr:hypothetical protein HDU92_003598 [Lobulomyces angularis]
MVESTKIQIVSGASRGIGLYTVKSLIEQGKSVLAFSRTSLSDLTEEARSILINKNVLYKSFDLSTAYLKKQEKNPFLCSFFDDAKLKFGNEFSFESFTHNAGVLHVNKLRDESLEELRDLFEINLFSAIGIVKEILPLLENKTGKSTYCPKIIFVSSGAAVNPYGGWGAYCSSKASLNMINSVLAVEEKGITCLAIRPGVIDTGLQDLIRKTGKDVMPDYEKFVNLKKENKLLPPEVVGKRLADIILKENLHNLTGKFLDISDPQLQ